MAGGVVRLFLNSAARSADWCGTCLFPLNSYDAKSHASVEGLRFMAGIPVVVLA